MQYFQAHPLLILLAVIVFMVMSTVVIAILAYRKGYEDREPPRESLYRRRIE